jgi:hypothetical protein
VWVIGSVTLPYGPSQISDEVDCQTDSLDLDGVAPILFATAPGIRVVSWSGSISAASHSKANLETDYGGPLRGMQGTSQSVTSGSGAYDGTWLVKKVSLREVAEGDKVVRLMYTVVLHMGSALVVL